MNVRWAMPWLLVLVAGCQSTRDQLLAEGYPPPFADGFQDGCGSGRQAAGSISGHYKKDVPRYLKDKAYAVGWDDGFRQCQAMLDQRDRLNANQIWNDRDRAWEQQKTQDMGKAYRSR
ncbi:hypothetical protein [Pseudomonas sp. DWP3-1-2]|uniref:hypothetical protein n=1 Tax=Pseudomonas sp. DWP3-1-2 TaxID=2804645 RepID=UPI003CEDBF2A